MISRTSCLENVADPRSEQPVQAAGQQIEHPFHKQPEPMVRSFLQQPGSRSRERGAVGILHRWQGTIPV
jgi:hypothetical protein